MISSRPQLLRRSIIAGVVAVAIGVPAICATSAALADAPVTGTLKMNDSSTWYAGGEFIVKNSSAEARDWSLTFRVPSGDFQNNSTWNMNTTIDGDLVTITPKEKLAAGGTTNIGFGINGQGTGELSIEGCDLDGHGVQGCSVGGGEEQGDTEPPSFMDDIRATATDPNTVHVSWSAASDNVGVTEYRVYDGHSQKPLAVVDGDTLESTVTGLTADSPYAFQVYAYDKAGNHSGSTIVEVITPAEPGEELDTEAPSLVSRIDAKATGPTTVELDWAAATDNVGVTEYRVWDGHEFVKTVDGSTLHAEIDGLAPETPYGFHVYAFDAAGNHGGSTIVGVVTLPAKDTAAPTVPTDLTAHTVDSDTIHVMWSHSADNIGVAGYKVYQDDRMVKDLKNGMRMTDIDGLEADTEYRFQVLAYDAAGNESAKTDVVTGKTEKAQDADSERPSDITCIEAVATSPTTVDVTWTPATDNVGVTKYVIHNGSGQTGLTVDGDTTSATLTGLKADTSYTISVYAYDAAGNHGISVMKGVHTPKQEETPGTGTPAPDDFTAKASSYKDGHRTMDRVEMTWTPDAATKRYEISLDGKRAQTLLVGADQQKSQKRYLLLGEHQAGTHTVAIRAQLSNGQWSDYSDSKTVHFTK
ncbi:hypothetical protein AX769_09960 [Frondihabitans sp. PAMC 28766]|uniref:fibronectin type III domain-containing protein n=1 Tax=Frondihabitans sp. PAMC 28766 TaxID=1795630 RepID=UPI00078C7216|nr:fibronectin type III domain-containing protein [Frondihabitans sp. PAMC 28766]AMM20415.1 hypothetical protein AX769_09960 [Frondihabitans sp. PAMC 28766]